MKPIKFHPLTPFLCRPPYPLAAVGLLCRALRVVAVAVTLSVAGALPVPPAVSVAGWLLCIHVVVCLPFGLACRRLSRRQCWPPWRASQCCPVAVASPVPPAVSVAGGLLCIHVVGINVRRLTVARCNAGAHIGAFWAAFWLFFDCFLAVFRLFFSHFERFLHRKARISAHFRRQNTAFCRHNRGVAARGGRLTSTAPR